MSVVLIKNASYIATMNDQDSIFTDYDILIENGVITQIAPNITAVADKVISAKNRVVLPGFVNTHHHLYQTLCRNVPIVQDAKLFDWLIHLYEIWRELTSEAVFVSTKLGLAELLMTGCTTTTDHFYVFPEKQPKTLIDDQVAAAREIGMRFHPCRGSMSRGKSKGGLPPDDVIQTEDEIIKDSLRLIEKYHDASPYSMLRIALAPCSPFSVTTELLRETVQLARDKGVRCHTHLAETIDEDDFCLKMLGKRPLDYMEEVGWLGNDIWFAHCVHLNDSEIRRMSETGTGVAHCPVSNLRLGSGIAPIPKMLAAGVPVGLAVDGSASNDSSAMLQELKVAMLVHRVGTGVEAMPAYNVLKMATRGGARVLGRDDIGSLEVGKAADVILFDINRLCYAGAMHDPIAALLFAGFDNRVETAIVNGRVLVEDYRVRGLDEGELINSANRIAAGMVTRATAKTGIEFLRKKK